MSKGIKDVLDKLPGIGQVIVDELVEIVRGILGDVVKVGEGILDGLLDKEVQDIFREKFWPHLSVYDIVPSLYWTDFYYLSVIRFQFDVRMCSIISWFLEILIIVVLLLLSVAYFTLAERKVLASMQRRGGPNVVGIWGLLQPLADGLKLLVKESILPSNANLIIFVIAPILTFLLSLLGWAVIPFGSHTVLSDLGIGFYFNLLGLAEHLQGLRDCEVFSETPSALMPVITSMSNATKVVPILDVFLLLLFTLGVVGGLFVVKLLLIKKVGLLRLSFILRHQ